MRVLVVGAGAVGSWLGGHLALGGAEVILVARGARAAQLAEGGLALAGPAGLVRLHPTLAPSVADAPGPAPDWALVCVKSYHSHAVAAELAAAGAASPRRVACFLNGVGNEAVLAEALGPDRVLAATLTTAVRLESEGTVAGGRGGVGLAEAAGAADLAGAFAAAGLEARRYGNAAAMKWSKLLLNLLGSATSALLGWTPAQVFASREVFRVELAAWREALAVMDGLGLAPAALPGYPVDRYAWLARHLPEAVLFRAMANRLGGGRGDRLPGLATDLAAGCRESEVAVLQGAVAAEGRRLGLPTPVCATLDACLREVAAGQRPWEEFRDRPERLRAAIAARAAEAA